MSCGTWRQSLWQRPPPAAISSFCIMDGTENYEAFRDTLKDMLDEINALQDTNLVYTCPHATSHTVRLRFVLTGDNKFIHICQGIDKANATYFCTLCPCSKAEIGNVTIDWPISRSLEQAHPSRGAQGAIISGQ